MSGIRLVSIYALADPRQANEVRYVGKSVNLAERMKAHRRSTRWEDSHKARWLKQVLASGAEPLVILLEEVPEDRWQQAEIRWIAYYRSSGAALTNANGGGLGGICPTAETRAKMSAAHETRTYKRGYKIGPEGRANMSAGSRGKNLGRVLTPETKAKIGAAHRGRQASPEARANQSAAAKMRWAKPEERAAQAERSRGKRMSPEAKAKQSAMKKGIPKNAETRRRMSEAQRKRPPMSANTRTKLSAAAKAQHAARRASQELSA